MGIKVMRKYVLCVDSYIHYIKSCCQIMVGGCFAPVTLRAVSLSSTKSSKAHWTQMR